MALVWERQPAALGWERLPLLVGDPSAKDCPYLPTREVFEEDAAEASAISAWSEVWTWETSEEVPSAAADGRLALAMAEVSRSALPSAEAARTHTGGGRPSSGAPSGPSSANHKRR